MDVVPVQVVAERLRRLLSPASTAPGDAAPAGHTSGRLGIALWEVFPGHVALLDRDGFVLWVNRAWRAYGLARGATASTGLGLNYLEVCARAADQGSRDAAEAAAVVEAALHGEQADPWAYPTGCEVGLERWFTLQAVPLPGQHSGALVIHTDITADRNREHEWRHRALHDSLTGLPNRALLIDRLEHAVAGAARDPRSLALLFVDLDSFKKVNDRLGHNAGDEVLRQTALRLSAAVRTSDTVGRLGGDEFLVIAEHLDDPATLDDLIARLAEATSTPVDLGGRSVVVTASIGVACLESGQDAGALLDVADRALLDLRGRRYVASRFPTA